LIRKLVDEYFYILSKPFVVHDWDRFRQFDRENLFDIYYLDKLQQLNFQKDISLILNPETKHVKNVMIQKYKFNSHSHFEIKSKDYLHWSIYIIFLLSKIKRYPKQDKFKIIKTVIQYMKDLLDYAQFKSQDIENLNRNHDFFDFYKLFHNSFHTFLADLFQYEICDETKNKIIYDLYQLEKQSKNYKFNSFLEILTIDFKDLSIFLHTATLIYQITKDIQVLSYYFECQFQCFFNLSSDIEMIEYDETAQYIYCQFMNSDFKEDFRNIVKIFDPRGVFMLNLYNAIHFRMERFRGNIIEEEAEDYDY
jgi:hypothetical protein